MKKFKFLEHTADVKFQAYGKTVEEAFENSALALIEYVANGKVKSEKKISFNVNGKDLESLMYNFLEEILYFIDAKNFLTAKIKITLGKDKKSLNAKIFGEKIRNEKGYMHVKAVTYNDMFIKNLGGKKGWVAQVVLDI